MAPLNPDQQGQDIGLGGVRESVPPPGIVLAFPAPRMTRIERVKGFEFPKPRGSGPDPERFRGSRGVLPHRDQPDHEHRLLWQHEIGHGVSNLGKRLEMANS